MVIDPDYSAFIVRARIIAKQEGYALAIHGSTTRDLDLIAVPWTKGARTPQALTARIDFNTGWRRQRADGTRCEIGEKVEPTVREHGRLVWTFMPDGFADPRFVDFSVMPLGAERCENPESSRPLPPVEPLSPNAGQHLTGGPGSSNSNKDVPAG